MMRDRGRFQRLVDEWKMQTAADPDRTEQIWESLCRKLELGEVRPQDSSVVIVRRGTEAVDAYIDRDRLARRKHRRRIEIGFAVGLLSGIVSTVSVVHACTEQSR